MIAVEIAGLFRGEVTNGKWVISLLGSLPKGTSRPTKEDEKRDIRFMRTVLDQSTANDIKRGLYGTVSEPDIDLHAARAAVSWFGGLIVDTSEHTPYPPVGGEGDIAVA
jgi:hypothetical protein